MLPDRAADAWGSPPRPSRAVISLAVSAAATRLGLLGILGDS